MWHCKWAIQYSSRQKLWHDYALFCMTHKIGKWLSNKSTVGCYSVLFYGIPGELHEPEIKLSVKILMKGSKTKFSSSYQGGRVIRVWVTGVPLHLKEPGSPSAFLIVIDIHIFLLHHYFGISHSLQDWKRLRYFKLDINTQSHNLSQTWCLSSSTLEFRVESALSLHVWCIPQAIFSAKYTSIAADILPFGHQKCVNYVSVPLFASFSINLAPDRDLCRQRKSGLVWWYVFLFCTLREFSSYMYMYIKSNH